MRIKTRYGIDLNNVNNIIKAIKENKLLCVINNNTTYKVCYCEGYIINDNKFDLIAVNHSGAIGMDRVFACCYYGLLGEILKLTDEETYKELTHIRNYRTLGNY